MTDLHTHILPGMDDGARDVDTSLTLLRMEAEQGVDAVILTPHFYRDRENIPHFLDRRAKAVHALADALMALPEDERRTLPRLALGAEVAWMPNLAEWEELPRLCLGTSRHFLLELPFAPWSEQLVSQLYELPGRTGLTPVIAHIERYLKNQKSQHIEAVLSMGVPVQVSAEPLLHPLRRGAVLRLLRERKAQLLASDAHSPEARPPNLGAAMDVVRRRLGDSKADSLVMQSDVYSPCQPETFSNDSGSHNYLRNLIGGKL